MIIFVFFVLYLGCTSYFYLLLVLTAKSLVGKTVAKIGLALISIYSRSDCHEHSAVTADQTLERLQSAALLNSAHE